jgi:hypothetical protein
MQRTITDYTCIHTFSALKYENKCICMMCPHFQFFENERPRHACSPNIENEDALEASLCMLVSACWQVPDCMASMQRNSIDQNVNTVYVRISCIC